MKTSLIPPAIGLIIGTGIGYVDSRPTWDDAGITAGAVFVAAGLLAVASPRFGWLTGLAVGLPVFVLSSALHGNYGSVAAVAVALVGAGLGMLVGKALGIGVPKPRVPDPPDGA